MSDPNPSSPKPDDGFYVEADTLARLGGGDVAKGRAELRLMLADRRERKPNNGPTAQPENVRIATIRDEPAILDLLLADIAENAKLIAPISIKRIMEQVTTGTRHRGGFCFVVDSPIGQPWAVAVLSPVKWWWSDNLFLSETSLYVAPEARHTTAAMDLLQAERWITDEMTAAVGYQVYSFASVSSTYRNHSKLRLYLRGSNPAGGFTVYPDAGRGLGGK